MRSGEIAADSRPHARGSDHGSVKLTETKVVELRRAHHAGVTMRDLATRYGVTYSTVHLIVTGKKWAHAGGPVRPRRRYRHNRRA